MSTFNLNNLDLNDLYLFVKVVEAHSFSEASRQLCIPKATISRRIAKLEKTLGIPLIQRNTRQFEITHIGQTFYEHCLELVERAYQVQAFIDDQDESKGSIRFSCPKEMVDQHLSPVLLAFMKQYPDIRIHIENTSRTVDTVLERLDFAVRGRPLPLNNSDLVVRPFFLSTHYLVASPQLISAPIQHPDELKEYAGLSWQSFNSNWTFVHPIFGKMEIPYKPRLTSDNFYLLKQAAIDAVGMAVLPEALVMESIQKGELISVLPPNWELSSWMVHAVYNSRKGLSTSARLLIDFMAAFFETQ